MCFKNVCIFKSFTNSREILKSWNIVFLYYIILKYILINNNMYEMIVYM